MSKRLVPHVSLTLLMVSILCTFCPVVTHLVELDFRAPTLIAAIFSHFSHWSLNHFIWDAGTFFLLATLYETKAFGGESSPHARGGMLMMQVLNSALLISLILLLFPSSFSVYRGLSGICVSLYVLLLIDCWNLATTSHRVDLKIISIAAGAGLGAKILYEQLTHAALFVSDASFVVATLAHVVGFGAPLFLLRLQRISQRELRSEADCTANLLYEAK